MVGDLQVSRDSNVSLNYRIYSLNHMVVDRYYTHKVVDFLLTSTGTIGVSQWVQL